MKFQPKLWPTLFTISALIVLLALGTWQLYRLQWKNNIISEIEYKTSLTPIDLPTTIDNMEDFEYRIVNVSGEFLHDKEVHLFTGPRVHRGKSGYNILTPMKRADGSYILVDRGWVPSTMKNSNDRFVEGEVTIEGMIHKGEHKGRFTMDNNLKDNIWFWIDIDRIKRETGLELPNYYIRAVRHADDAWEPIVPIAGDIVVKRRNDHLQYAITWYSFAIILLVIYFLYHRRPNE